MSKIVPTKPPLDTLCTLIPPLSAKFYKGQLGRVGVIGGSEEYTGAPYFSAISALKLGADLAHVICQPTAAIVIKSYSPVHPYMRRSEKNPDLSADEIINNVEELFPRLHVLVVGPGLSRDLMMLNCAQGIIQKAKEKMMPIIIDADGLFLVQNNPNVIKDYPKAILTPNLNEFKRLCETMNVSSENNSLEEMTQQLSKAFGGVIIVNKGKTDFISNGNVVFFVDNEGGLKRCGGQGDVLTGLIATFLDWGLAYQNKIWQHDNKISPDDIIMLASFAGCVITRECSRIAFGKLGRSVQTSDIISEIAYSFNNFLEGKCTQRPSI
ncbi:4437_t:CDS:10 [Diversispora eburnea]|uniref:ATP-dependent (S)-NAD(P)H-hydrate dehydratase n=1 Tax=Diversispora eburnea TaxID=1213867 RepID=A0A9N9F344_9GLOM|nr:4437_t:CDS:10 [Diversispora eburnea]